MHTVDFSVKCPGEIQIANCISARTDRGISNIEKEGSGVVEWKERRYRIRKLTPREVWRLMGYTDEDFDKAAAVNSQSQLYKEAGNAIVKQVLMAIFRQLKLKTKGENNVR